MDGATAAVVDGDGAGVEGSEDTEDTDDAADADGVADGEGVARPLT